LTVLDSTAFLGDLLPEEGSLTGDEPAPEEVEDMLFGRRVAREVAGMDIGQTVVVKGKAVIAVEAIEGTDEAIRRAGALAGPGVVVVKVAKPKQDKRFDMPVIGLETVKTLVAARARPVGDAGQTIVSTGRWPRPRQRIRIVAMRTTQAGARRIPMTVLLVEASALIYRRLSGALRARRGDWPHVGSRRVCESFGVRAGTSRPAARRIRDPAPLSAFGFVELLPRLAAHARKLADVAEFVRRERPTAVVAIDYGGFAMLLARLLGRECPFHFFIPPKIWVWGRFRGRMIARDFARVHAIFPFEAEAYRRAGANVGYVGHPLVELAAPAAEPGTRPGAAPRERWQHAPAIVERSTSSSAATRGRFPASSPADRTRPFEQPSPAARCPSRGRGAAARASPASAAIEIGRQSGMRAWTPAWRSAA
jgi:hypothetical protein